MSDQNPFSPLGLMAPDGARLQLHPQGAHIASWVPAASTEQLFLSAASEYREGVAIRGGVPVIFPQFASEGPLPKHGFARALPWTMAESGEGHCTLLLRDSAATHAIWPHAFAARLSIRFGGPSLSITLALVNTSAEPFRFTAALHTYLRVDDIGAVTVSGLRGLNYRDSAHGGSLHREGAEALRIAGEVDRIYLDVPGAVDVSEPGRRIRVTGEGFPDVVIWNPGADKSAQLKDMEAEGWRRMLCVEAAVIGAPVELAPGARWAGTQTLVVS